MKKDVLTCAAAAAVSILVAAICHRFLPGFGAAFKPLLWPLLALPFRVRAVPAAVTAFCVPLASACLNGMPAWDTAFGLAFAAVAAVGVLAFVRTRLPVRA